MVIAQIIGNLSIGGAERLFVNLCNALEADKVIVVLVGDTDIEPNLASDLRDDIEVHRLRVRQRSWLLDLWRLSRLLREKQCDVVHTHMFWPNLHGSLAANLASVPVLVTSEHGRNEWKWKWHRWIDANIISRHASARLCVSQDILQMRRDKDGVPANLLRLVPNGTAVPPLVESKRQERLIGSVGRLVGAKDFPTMIRAIGILAKRGSDVRLEIVGEGGERRAIEDAIRTEGVEDHVALVGSQNNVGSWLARWSLFVSSSVREGQPVALLEAMASGLPCVATAVGGVPDTLADGIEGIVVAPNDPEALADGIQTLLDNSDLRTRYGKAARDRVINDFSIESLAAKCREIYASALPYRTDGAAQ
jgi:glycosyltransferase involved in cell wall biosynthesis